MSGGPLLSDYTNAKLRLGDLLQTFLRFAEQRHDEERIRYIRELLADLAEDNFRIALFGKYNRGKSTLMNALLGTDRLPTGVLPLTSVVTTVRYDSREHVDVLRAGWSFTQEIPIDQLRNFVTEEGNPGNEKQVLLAQVYLPADLLRYGFFLIDTPGLGSSIAENTKAAEAFIPRADAAIVVMSAESPLDEQDFELLEKVHREVGTVFVVLNKTDLLRVQDHDLVLEAFTRRVRSLVPEAVVVALSAKDALPRHGVAAPDGVTELTHALIGFVSKEKTSHLVVRTSDRIRRLLRDEQTIDLLSTQSPTYMARLSLEAQSAIAAAAESGESTLHRLLEKASTTTDALRGALRDWVDTHLHRASQRKVSVESVVDFLMPRGLLQPFTVVPDCKETVRSLNELIQQATDRVSSALPCGGIKSGQTMGDALLSEPISSLPNFQWKITHRVLILAGIGMLPFLARVVLRPTLERFSNQIEREITQAVQHRVELLADQYGHVMEDLSARCKGFHSHLPSSPRAELLSQLAKDLNEICLMGGGRVVTGTAYSTCLTPHTGLLVAACKVCEELSEIQYGFLREYQYKLSSDPMERARNAERGGFCGFHTWLYEATGSPQGISTGYAPVLLSWADRLERLANHVSATDLEQVLQSLRSDSPNCHICNLVHSACRRRVQAIASQPESDVSSLCVLHTCEVLLQGVNAETSKRLVGHVSVILRRTAEDMQQFALKQRGLRSSLTASNERTAYLQGLRLLVGEKRLSYIKTVTEI